MSDQNFSAIRARLRYETIEDFIEGYARFISAGGMFIPMKPGKLKPIGTTIRFQFLLGDGSTALLGEGVVLQVRAPDDASPQSPVGMLIKFTKLAQESKALVDRIVGEKSGPADDDHESYNIHNERTPLPEDKESYERKTRESFEKNALNQLIADDSSEADVHLKQTDAGGELSKLQDTTRERRIPAGLVDQEPRPVTDVFESEEEANDAVVAAALAVASEVADEEKPEANPLDELFADDEPAVSPEEEQPEPATTEGDSEPSSDEDVYELEEELRADPSTAEASSDDPETREAPEVAQIAVQEEVVQKGPMQLGETAGGLKILAFDDDMDASALAALQEFSFGAEEADIDDMFDGLFGGGDDELGGMFGGGESAGDGQPSMEFELPASGATQEVAVDLVEEEMSLAEADSLAQEDAEEPAVSADPAPFSLEDLMSEDDDEPGAEVPEEQVHVLEEPASTPEFHAEPEEDDEPSFDLDAPVLEAAAEESEPEFLLDSRAESEPEFVDEDLSFVEDADSDADDEQQAEYNAAEENIHDLLDHLDEQPKGIVADLHLGGMPEPKVIVEEEEDEESLESLLASARREIEEKSAEEPRDSAGDILDQLLGDDLPPPPQDAPVFGLPQPDKKKKGFLSKLFDKN